MTFQERIVAQLQTPENQICADCKSQASNYFESTTGIFLCRNCSEIHQNVFSQFRSHIVPINNHNFTKTDLFYMEICGNKYSNEYYEYSLNPEDRPDPNNAENMRQFIIDKYERKRWANSLEYPPNSFKRAIFGRKTIFAQFIDFLNFLNYSIIFLEILVSLILMFLCIKYNKVLVSTTFSLMIAIETNESIKRIRNYYNIGINLLIEAFFGILGFGLYKGILAAISIKLIAKGIEYGGKACILFVVASVLISIGFGFENMMACAVSFIILFSCAYFYFDLVSKGDIMYFGYAYKQHHN